MLIVLERIRVSNPQRSQVFGGCQAGMYRRDSPICTSQSNIEIQPFDIAIHGTFKLKIKHAYAEWALMQLS